MNLDRLVYWINERESIRRKRALGLSPPWTDDPILQKYRFCNVRRMDDKVSRWLYQNWYKPYRDHPNMLVAVGAARFFNLPSTLEHLTKMVFGKLDFEKIVQVVRGLPRPVFNGAYVVSTSGNNTEKIGFVVERYISPLRSIQVDTVGMEKMYGVLLGCYGISSFMAGQIVTDLRWALSGRWSDRKTWAAVGPGSRRGINRLRGRALDYPLSQQQFSEELAAVIEVLGGVLSSDTVKRLEAMDYQNCLCEYDKYERVRLGEGRPKQLYRYGG